MGILNQFGISNPMCGVVAHPTQRLWIIFSEFMPGCIFTLRSKSAKTSIKKCQDKLWYLQYLGMKKTHLTTLFFHAELFSRLARPFQKTFWMGGRISSFANRNSSVGNSSSQFETQPSLLYSTVVVLTIFLYRLKLTYNSLKSIWVT